MSTLLADNERIGLVSPLIPAKTSKAAASETESGAGDEPWNRIIQAVHDLHALKNDWDGQGASAPTPGNLAAVADWVRRMRAWPHALPPDQVVPGVNGEVYLIWQRPGLMLEAEVSRPESIEWLLAIESQPARQWETSQDVPWLVVRLADDSGLTAASVQR